MKKRKKPVLTPSQMRVRGAVRRIRRAAKAIVEECAPEKIAKVVTILKETMKELKAAQKP